jgi:flagellar protein FlbD
MIFLTRLDKQEMYINPDHIVSVEETPDTVIALFNGHHFIVKESARVIISRIIAFRARVVRRSGNFGPKKYLARTRKSLFHSDTLNREATYPGGLEQQARSPFHSRES